MAPPEKTGGRRNVLQLQKIGGLAHLYSATAEAAPRLAIVEAWAPRTMASGDSSYPQFSFSGFVYEDGPIPLLLVKHDIHRRRWIFRRRRFKSQAEVATVVEVP
jgi:hypothetical protein